MNAVAARPLLLADRGCPFAHRVRSLLDHLGVGHDLIESPPGERPAGLDRWSTSGRIPLLVHGDLSIGESRVMLEHLAEAYAFEKAYPASVVERTLHREAMAIVDSELAPALLRDSVAREARLAECLGRLDDVARMTLPSPCVLSFHVAPIWLRLQWWQPKGAVTRSIRERPRLAEWLDAAAQLPSVARTSPSRAENTRDFEAIVCALKS